MNSFNRIRRRAPQRNDSLVALAQGTHGKSGEVLQYGLFDTFTFSSTVNSYKFFTVPQNGGSPAKTPADTNNLLSGQMVSSYRLTVESLKTLLLCPTSVTTTVLGALYTELFNATLAAKIPGKDDLGYWTLAEIMGLSTMLNFDATIGSAPQPRYTGNYRLNIPIVLAANTTFSFDLTHQAAPSAYCDGVRLKLILSGILERVS